jgi:hypothetical protein
MYTRSGQTAMQHTALGRPRSTSSLFCRGLPLPRAATCDHLWSRECAATGERLRNRLVRIAVVRQHNSCETWPTGTTRDRGRWLWSLRQTDSGAMKYWVGLMISSAPSRPTNFIEEPKKLEVEHVRSSSHRLVRDFPEQDRSRPCQSFQRSGRATGNRRLQGAPRPLISVD